MPSFVLPIEWASCLNNDDDPEECEFESELFIDWLREHSHLTFSRYGDRFDTSAHEVGGYYSGETLICREVFFIENQPGSFNRTVRRECRISVPQPTKLPLP